MLHIVIPMAGRGSRFAVAGYPMPKPLIPVHGRPMIATVVDNLRPSQPHVFTFLCQQSQLATYGLRRLLESTAPGCRVIPIEGITAGAACTVLLARDLIDHEQPLMIANCDQWIDVDIDHYLDHFGNDGHDGLIMTMTADSPKWSYVRRDGEGRVCEVVEKQVVSHEATVGIYNFARGRDFVAAADEMIAADERVQGEFYVAPVYNRMLSRGARVRTCPIGSVGNGMYGLGVPEDLEQFHALGLLPRMALERRSHAA
jgi:NDP-sugar pyrophosphorylase family protein